MERLQVDIARLAIDAEYETRIEGHWVKPKVWMFLPEFMGELVTQLADDDLRHNETWLTLPLKGQEERIWKRYEEYYRLWKTQGYEMPWLKIAGLALIGWIRMKYPRMFP